MTDTRADRAERCCAPGRPSYQVGYITCQLDRDHPGPHEAWQYHADRTGDHYAWPNAVTDPREARISDPRADTIRHALECYAPASMERRGSLAHKALAALDGLLADAAEQRRDAQRCRDGWAEAENTLRARVAALEAHLEMNLAAGVQEQKLRDALHARVAALETALAQERRHSARLRDSQRQAEVIIDAARALDERMTRIDGRADDFGRTNEQAAFQDALARYEGAALAAPAARDPGSPPIAVVQEPPAPPFPEPDRYDWPPHSPDAPAEDTA